MKKLISHMKFRMVLPLLFLAVLLTLPTASTGSKYVWNDTIPITLEIVINKSWTTSGVSSQNSLAIFPSDYWVQDLENIQVRSTADGLILTAEQGYTLPESITVTIGEKIFTVSTDGTEPPDGITFNPETGLLTIAEKLIEENLGKVTVTAVAVPEEIADVDTPADGNPTEGKEPAGDGEPVDEGKPVDESKTADESKPVEESKPADESKPVDESKPADESKSVDEESVDEGESVGDESSLAE